MSSYDLPDYLPGQPQMYGVKQESPKFYQGIDINLKVDLKDEEKSADFNDYSLLAYVKSSLSSHRLIWRGYLNYGIFHINREVWIKIPSSVTSGMKSGIYYLTVVGITRQDPRHSVVLFNDTFSINPAASSEVIEIPQLPSGSPPTLAVLVLSGNSGAEPWAVQGDSIYPNIVTTYSGSADPNGTQEGHMGDSYRQIIGGIFVKEWIKVSDEILNEGWS